MGLKVLASDLLWDVASTQHGFVTAGQAQELGVTMGAGSALVILARFRLGELHPGLAEHLVQALRRRQLQ